MCIYDRVAFIVFQAASFKTATLSMATFVASQAPVICASPKLNSCSLPLPPLQSNAEELRAERLRRATERLRSPVVFNKDSAVRKTQLKSFSQYVESRPGKDPPLRHHWSTPVRLIHILVKSQEMLRPPAWLYAKLNMYLSCDWIVPWEPERLNSTWRYF